MSAKVIDAWKDARGALQRLHNSAKAARQEDAVIGVTLLAVLAIASTALIASPAQAAEACRFDLNCILNPSLTDDTEDPRGTPDHWRMNTFGQCDAVFTTTRGRTDPRAVTVTVSNPVGAQDAKWVFEDIPVIGGQYYEFTDWYKSSTPTQLTVFFTSGAIPYVHIAEVPASKTPDTWTQLATTGFFVPAGATAMTVTHILAGAGTLTTDDHSLVLRPAPTFLRGIVSLTFDDGWRSVVENAIPILNAVGIRSTQYINTDPILPAHKKYAGNMSVDDLLALQRDGHEIGAHTRSHLNLVRDLSDEASRQAEIVGSRDDLLRAGIERVETFAYPFGGFNDEVRAIVAERFLGARSVDPGYNTTNTDRYALKNQMVFNSTTFEEIRARIDYTISNDFWLILTFHQVAPTFDDCVYTKEPGQEQYYCTDVATLRAVADYLKRLPDGSTPTVQEVLNDPDLWSRPPPNLVEKHELPHGESASAKTLDPPSTYVGERITIEKAMNIAYGAGFRAEGQLLAAVGIAVSVSGLWTKARNWQPERGDRPATDIIRVRGPTATWSSDGAQMHSDRGLFQISSYWWPGYTDEAADDPTSAATAFFNLSKKGTDFSISDSYRSGRAQRHFDQASDGFPPLRPLVRDFLSRLLHNERFVSAVPAAPQHAVFNLQIKAPSPSSPNDRASVAIILLMLTAAVMAVAFGWWWSYAR